MDKKLLILLCTALLVNACTNRGLSTNEEVLDGINTATYTASPRDLRDARVGKLFGSDFVVWNSNGGRGIMDIRVPKGASINVNQYLWYAALHKVSFMPIANANPSSGVITTEWYQIKEYKNDRYKINVIISGTEINSNAVRVNIFKEIRSKDGKWHATSASPLLAKEIEEQIIDNARKLRNLKELEMS